MAGPGGGIPVSVYENIKDSLADYDLSLATTYKLGDKVYVDFGNGDSLVINKFGEVASTITKNLANGVDLTITKDFGQNYNTFEQLPDGKTIYSQYDKNNQLQTRTTSQYDTNGDYHIDTTDGQGNLLSETTIKTIDTLDGQRTVVTTILTNGSLTKTYDSANNLLSTTSTDLNDVKTTTFYNAANAIIGFSVTSTDANGNNLIINTDAQGNIVSRTTVTVLADGSTLQSIVLPNGHATEVTISPNGTVTKQEIYTPAETLTHALSTTLDALSLIRAIQTGQPLPIVVSGLRLANQIDVVINGGTTIDGVRQINTNLSGAANVGSSILSVLSFSNALKNGDTLGAVTSGTQAVGFATKAYIDFALGDAAQLSSATELGSILNGNGVSIIGTDGSLQLGNAGVIAYLNIVNELANGDYIGAAIDSIAIAYPPFAPVAIAYHVFRMIFDLFGGEDIPDAWGNGQYRWNGSSNSVTYRAVGETGGQEAVSAVMQQTLSFMNSLVEQQRAANPSNPLGIIPNRLPNISYGYDLGGYRFSDIDPLTGVDNHPGLTYDTSGRPFNATPGSPESFQSIAEALIRSAITRGAIAPQWEVDTAYLQTQHGAPYAGLSEEERAARTGHINTAISSTATTQTARVIGLDLDGNGIQTITEAQSNVVFDIDNSAYLKNSSWIGSNDAILTLDRNANGSIDNGYELFNNTAIDLSQRGIKSLAWADSNNDGLINNTDPVYHQLKVWRDSNSNGVIDAGENTAISYNGITQLSYNLGTYTVTNNGITQTKQMASVDLTADTQGTRTQIVPEGILIQTSEGHLSLIATKVDDESALAINQDRITTYENTEIIVSAADLFANDTYISTAGVMTPATNLRLSAIDNFNHGTAFIDSNNFIHFTPYPNFSGTGGGFDYHTLSPSGLLWTGHVDVVMNAVNDAPVVDSVTHNQRAIYGWKQTSGTGYFGITPFPGHTATVTYNGGSGMATIGQQNYTLTVPIYQPYDTGGPVYQTIIVMGMTMHQLVRTDPIVHHDTVIAYDNPNSGQVIASDADDPVSSLNYQIVGLPQWGGVTISADGHYQYTGWASPNVPLSPAHAQNDSAQTDAFQVRVTDPHGVSVLQTINVTHYGIYTPPAPPEGEDGGCPVAIDMDNNGFAFVPVADSSVFFDISNDGWKHRVSWVAPGDGWLAYDADHNGKIERADELAFAAYAPDAKTDLEGLALAFDSNHDAQFTSADDKWADFGIWVDANSNGITDAGEYKTLNQLGVASIDLVSDGQFSTNGGSTINGMAKVHMLDGTTHDAADVTLRYNDDIQIPQADGSTIIAQHPKSSAPNRIDGSANADLILAQSGPMEVYAVDGNDFVQGGAGDDYIEAGNGNDVAYAGDGNDIIDGGADNDTVFAGNGNDLTVGGTGEDAIFGEAGNDIMYGGDGNDLISGGSGNDVLSGDKGDDIMSGEEGNDALFGMTGNDLLNSGAGNDQLYGGVGNDLLDGGTGADNMLGATGDDIYVVNDSGDIVTENVNEGADTVRASITYTLGANVENLTLTGTDNLSGIGNALDNIFIGNSGNNTLTGGDGNDTLNGGRGSDTLVGGTGHDTYVVDNIGDIVTENVSEGADTVKSSINYTLGTNLENLTLTGSTAINATGNELDNAITGNGNNNTLDGGAGADTLIGGAGNDTYIVDNIADVVTESAQEGADKVLSGVTFKLSANVENLTLTGNEAIDGTGNEINNTLIGNSAANALNGGAGNDNLDGGVGTDALIGGAGNDTYIVDNIGDVVTENTNEGNDTVLSSVTYTLSPNVENMTLTGINAINATGNDLNNNLVGNNNDNIIDGGTGTDTMIGGAGNDTYIVDNVGDVVTEKVKEGIDAVDSSINYTLGANLENLTLTGNEAINGTGNTLNNTLIGNGIDNFLNGGTGSDTLIGGAGNDTYIVDNDGDAVTERVHEGIDTVQSTIDYTLGTNLENLILTGLGAINATGNELNNTITGNSADNIIDGGAGVDTLIGGAGNDTYIVDNVVDTVIENLNEGTDTVLSSVTYMLAANVENITLTGVLAINATGNELNNTLIGNSSDNAIDGSAGADTMIGSAGNDTYIVDNVGDVVTENTNEGTDAVQSSISYALGANLENLTLIGGNVINAVGNELDNVIIGNGADNILDGHAGEDSMIGGAGNDTYVVDNINDVVTENIYEGTDNVLSSVSYTLSLNAENMTLTGSASINAIGNNLDNIIQGNDGNNILDGATGADSMTGGLGNDTYVVDNVLDIAIESLFSGTDTIVASISYTLGDNFENLTLTGDANLVENGNSLDNILHGNSGNNTLDGKAGSDVMSGAAGDDLYIVDNLNDAIIENLNEGNDSVQSSVSYALSANVENLLLTGSADINATGNDLANFINGNAGSNMLDGGDGNDILIGSAGNDELFGGQGDDTYYYNLGDGLDEIVDVAGIDTMRFGSDLTLDNISMRVVTVNGQNIAQLRLLDGAGIEIENQGFNFSINHDNNDNIVSPIEKFIFGDGEELLVNDLLVKQTTLNGTNKSEILIGDRNHNTSFGSNGEDTLYGYGANDTLFGENGNDVLYGGVGKDKLYGGNGTDILYGESGSDLLDGGNGNDSLYGGKGNDIMQGMNGDDVLSDTEGKNVFDAGSGNDSIVAGNSNDLVIGGRGNDIITTGTGYDVIVFNKGDGQDIVNASTGADNTISLGGNFAYSDLSLTKTGNNLLLKMGNDSDQITLKDWYLGTTNKSVVNLQVITEAVDHFSLGSADQLRNNKIENFNFANLVTAFDAAGAIVNWQLTDARLTTHLQTGSDSAIGGDMAYQYGKNSNLTGISLASAQITISAASFGQLAQTLHNPSVWQAEVVKLG